MTDQDTTLFDGEDVDADIGTYGEAPTGDDLTDDEVADIEQQLASLPDGIDPAEVG